MDCVYFRGDMPCPQHKISGAHCHECKEYKKSNGVALIIKLGAIGDVIRTSALIDKIRKEHPNFELWWLSNTPEIVSSSVDRVFGFNLESLTFLQQAKVNHLINLYWKD
jgi:heptosyltransferase-2